MATGTTNVRITGDASDFRNELRLLDHDLKRVEGRVRVFTRAAFWRGWAAGAAAVTLAGVLDRVF